VREDHTAAGREAVNTLVTLKLEGMMTTGMCSCQATTLFVPPAKPDGTRLAWLPESPEHAWDGSELWVGSFGETD